MNTEFTTLLEQIESTLTKYLPSSSNEEWKTTSFGSVDSCVNDEHLANLINPCSTLISLGGKRWRPLLLLLCAQLTSLAKKGDCSKALANALNITPLVEFAHNASLIHDDIEDCADTRRGKPAAHITYGLDVALNAGSWLYFQASSCIQNLNASAQEKLDFYELFLQELRRLHLGQAMDILWHRNPQIIPSQEEYTAMVRNKTGTLARLAVKLGVLAGGGSPEEAEKAGFIAQDIGTGFQILDDVTNLTKGNPGKKRGDDIVEGKKSLPVLLHIAANPQDKDALGNLFEQARKEGIDSPAVEKAISILSESGAIEKARQKGTEIITEKTMALANLYGTEENKPKSLIIELFDSIQKKA
ncbi:MAG: polyprenyl synthetase family protein [Treponema sp.]|nr:polyprenyl synthetase family protein [Candidatus Treponema equifaecale]